MGTIAGVAVVTTGLAAGQKTRWYIAERGETVTISPETDVLLYVRDRVYPVIAGGSGGGGTPSGNVLQLNGQSLQLNNQNLSLGV